MESQKTILLGLLVLLIGCESAPPLPAPGTPPGSSFREIQPFAALDAVDPQERAAGVDLATRTTNPGTLPALRRMLGDLDGDVRARALDGLRVRGGPAELPLVRPLSDDLDPRVRRQVVRFLSAHEGGKAVPRLRRFFLEDDDEEVRALAIVSLSVLDEEAADLDAVTRLMEQDGEEVAPRLRQGLIAYLCRHSDRIGAAQASAIFTPLLTAEDPGLRSAAARALGEAGGADARAPLAEAFRREAEPHTASTMLLAEGKAGGRQLGSECRQILGQRTHWILQASAASYLGLQPQPAGAGAREELLVAALADPARDPRVRQTAAQSLADLGRVDALEEALESRDAETRRAALLAYPLKLREELVTLARRLMEDPDAAVRWSALCVRARVRDGSAYPELVEGLRQGYTHATDALAILLEITGGEPNHGFDIEAWRQWLVNGM